MDHTTKARIAKTLLKAAKALAASAAEEDSPADMWEALDWAENGWLKPEEIEKLKAEIRKYPNLDASFAGKVLDDTFIVDDKIIAIDGDDFEVKSKHDWAFAQMEGTYGTLKDDIEEKLAEQFNEDFQSSPVTLFHATASDNLESIMKSGLRAASRTRGLTNRGVGAAIFTYDEEGLALYGSYGDTVLAIDTKGMKRDGIEFYVTQEPAVVEQEAAGIVGSIAELDDFSWETGGDGADDPSTVILHIDRVPPKYLTLVSQPKS